MKRGILLISLALLFCVGGLRVPPVYAVLFGFSNITNNNSIDAAIGETQLFVDVTDAWGELDFSSTQALFTFTNTGDDNCSITDIYFHNYGSVLGKIDSIDNADPGVLFSGGADPQELPGAGTDFVTRFSAESDSPVQSNGVNPGESVGILCDLAWGGNEFFTLDVLLSALENVEDGSLIPVRIGIHVQGFDSGGSESFVNDLTPSSVPEPSTMLLLGVGLIGLAGIGRKKFVKK